MSRPSSPSEALATFRAVFAEEPAWADVVPRLAAVGVLPDDPTFLDHVLGRR